MDTNVDLLRVLFMAMIITARKPSRNCAVIVLILLSLRFSDYLPIHAYRNCLNYFFLIVGVLWDSVSSGIRTYGL